MCPRVTKPAILRANAMLWSDRLNSSGWSNSGRSGRSYRQLVNLRERTLLGPKLDSFLFQTIKNDAEGSKTNEMEGFLRSARESNS